MPPVDAPKRNVIALFPAANKAAAFELKLRPTASAVHWWLYRYGDLEARGRASTEANAKDMGAAVRRSIEADRQARRKFGIGN